jgi:ribonuclease E
MDKTNKMLIDATHPEETRVVVLRNGRVEEFDYESAARKALRGNIYLAKVTRVEPSLQAAFVEYGGNRHGFLAFNEIHPDYYQIPKADREALLEEEAAAEAEAEEEADERAARYGSSATRGVREEAEEHGDDTRTAHESQGPGEAHEGSHDIEAASEVSTERDEQSQLPDDASDEPPRAMTADHGGRSDAILSEGAEASPSDSGEDDNVEEVAEQSEAPETVSGDTVGAGGADVMEEMPERPRRQRRRHYKIQEVIKRRQIILVQVVKEERGNKGAALTTYLSLAGRYTVLMPNTGRGGGISRKITNMQDRKRLKAIAQELDIPDGMGLIIRTAGASRTKQEIKRDYEYLMRLWESVREMAIESTAPSLVYEEGNLIKRSIRDQYSKDVDQIVVAGSDAHREARDFMTMLMPGHADNVILHDRPEPLFARYQIERQLNAMFSPYVTLRSGGYLVINQTEALVSIDVNSGKSTREFSIEETALQTNLEAADEIARQLRLRDLAGLIVIDFIDMEEKRNNRAVERRLKDALRFDRARIQVGRISHFGLLEMSRQRLRTGVLEGSTSQCPHCQGTGIIRSVESVALAVLRGLEDHLMRDNRHSVTVLTTAQVALYILNNKRAYIVEIERRYGLSVQLQASDRMQGSNFAIERSALPVQPKRSGERAAVNMNWGFDGDSAEDVEPEVVEVEPTEDADSEVETIGEREDREPHSRGGDRERGEGGGRRRRRRGRGRGRGHDETRDSENGNGSTRHAVAAGAEGETNGEFEPQDDYRADEARSVGGSEVDQSDDGSEYEEASAEDDRRSGRQQAGDEGGERRGRRRRRGRRGGRRRDREGVAPGTGEQPDIEASPHEAVPEGQHDDREHAEDAHGNGAVTAATEVDGFATEVSTREAAEPVRAPSFAIEGLSEAVPVKVETKVAEVVHAQVSPEPSTSGSDIPGVAQGQQEPPRPARKGWWQKR